MALIHPFSNVLANIYCGYKRVRCNPILQLRNHLTDSEWRDKSQPFAK